MNFLRIDENYTIKHVAEHWKKQYFRYGMWPKLFGDKSSEEKYNLLLKATTIAEIETIIGNNDWTTERCINCGRRVYKWFNITGYDEIVSVCDDCIKTMAGMIEQ